MMFVFVFCNWMFSNFFVHCCKITLDCDIFLSYGIFWLPLHSHSVLHDYCSIEAALVHYQILLKEVMLNQKVVCYS